MKALINILTVMALICVIFALGSIAIKNGSNWDTNFELPPVKVVVVEPEHEPAADGNWFTRLFGGGEPEAEPVVVEPEPEVEEGNWFTRLFGGGEPEAEPAS